MRNLNVFLFLSCLICGTLNYSRGDISGSLNCGVAIDVHTSQTQLGSNLVWTITMVNNSTSNQTCALTRNVNAILYSGQSAGQISSVTTTNTLSSNETNTTEVTVTPSEYSRFTGVTKTFQMETIVEIPGTQDVWFAPVGGRIVLSTPTNILTFLPGPPITVGNAVTTTVSYLNPFSTNLTGVIVYISSDEHFSSTSSRIIAEIPIGTVATNSYVSASTNFTPVSSGTGTVWATITASNLMDVSTSSDIDITE